MTEHDRSETAKPRKRAAVSPRTEGQDDPSFGCVDWYQYPESRRPALAIERNAVRRVGADDRGRRVRQ